MPDGSYPRAENGIMYLKEKACAYISGNVVAETDLGTYTMFLADVTDAEVLSVCGSGFLQFLSEAYQTDSETGRKDRMDLQDLRICLRGRRASGRFNICPICKHPASDFERLS